MRSIEDESGDALQSARGVWRQSLAFCDFSPAQSRLQSARGVWRQSRYSLPLTTQGEMLQSARGVWRQRTCLAHLDCIFWLQSARGVWRQRCTSISSVLLINRCNLHGACGGKVVLLGAYNTFYTLQSARGVWKTLHHPPEKNPRKFMQTYCIFIHLGV